MRHPPLIYCIWTVQASWAVGESEGEVGGEHGGL